MQWLSPTAGLHKEMIGKTQLILTSCHGAWGGMLCALLSAYIPCSLGVFAGSGQTKGFFGGMWPKGWGNPFDTFWCCYGTGIESFTKLADSIFFHRMPHASDASEADNETPVRHLPFIAVAPWVFELLLDKLFFGLYPCLLLTKRSGLKSQ